MTISYQRDSKGLQQLLMTAEMDHAIGTVSEAGEAHFETIAPVRSGRYKESLRTVAEVSAQPTPRRARRLEVPLDYAADVERRRGVLGRVADLLERAR